MDIQKQNVERVNKALTSLVPLIGPQILSLPISIFPHTKKGLPPAYTTNKGIFVSQAVVDADVANLPLYLMHEIWHHVLNDDDHQHKHSNKVLNYAQDYKINQLIQEIYGFNVRKALFPGLRNKNFDNKSLKEIIVHLETHKFSHLVGHECGSTGICHPLIREIALKLRRRFADKIDNSDRHRFHMDFMDQDVFLAKLPLAIKATKHNKLNFLNINSLMEGVWAGLWQQNPVANPANKFGYTDAMVYCYPYIAKRSPVNLDADAAIMAAALYINHANEDDLFLLNWVERLTRRRNYLKHLESLPYKMRKEKSKHSLWRIRKRIKYLNERIRYVSRLKPIHELIRKHPVKATGKVIQRVSAPTLKSFYAQKNASPVFVPSYERNETSRRIRSIAKRSWYQLDMLLEFLQTLKKEFGSILEAFAENKKQKDDAEDKPSQEDQDEDNEKKQDQDKKNSPPESGESEEENTDQAKIEKQIEKAEKKKEEKKKKGKTSLQDSEDNEGDGDNEEGDNEGEGEGQSTGNQGKPNPIPVLLPLKTGKQPQEEQSDSYSQGDDNGKPSQLDVMTFALDHLESLTRIMKHMNEITSMLEKKTNRQTSNVGQDTKPAFGNNLSSVDSSEIALLANKKTKIAFMKRMAAHSLLQKDPPKNKRSPMVIAIDSSGSMMGERYEIAAGFALAMIRILAKDKRGVALMNFSDKVGQECVLQEGKIDVMRMLKVLMSPYWGGTNFDKPLHRALDIKKEQGWKKMTTIMVTDGYCNINNPDSLRERMSKDDQLLAVIAKGAFNNKDGIFNKVYHANRDGLKISLVNAGLSVL